MFIWYILAGLCGGLLGGMGMGGGTVLIPILTILLGVPQHTAQAINLIAFIPMSVVALALHIRNKLVDFKGIWWIVVPAALTAAGGSLLARAVSAKALARLFGVFLIVLSFFQFFPKKEKKQASEGKPPVVLTPPGRPLGCELAGGRAQSPRGKEVLLSDGRSAGREIPTDPVRDGAREKDAEEEKEETGGKDAARADAKPGGKKAAGSAGRLDIGTPKGKKGGGKKH